MGSIETSRIIKAFERHVPGCYVRDYREKGGWINIARGYMTIHDNFRDTDKFSTNIPAITLCSLPEGFTTRAAIYDGLRLVRPGWRVEMRRAAEHLSRNQREAIEKDLGVRVFS